MKKRSVIGVGIIFLAIITFILLLRNVDEKPIQQENFSESCIKLLNNIKKNNSKELGTLYDDIVIRNMHHQLLATGCDYGSEKVIQECIKEANIYKEKLTCVKNFLDISNISKEEFIKINVFE